MRVICVGGGVLHCSEVKFLGDILFCNDVWHVPISEVDRIEEDDKEEVEYNYVDSL